MDSFKKIEEIAKGDEVISYDHKTNKTLMGKVTNVFRRTAKKLALVTIGATLFSATPDHPFYANDEYVEASKLNVGDSIYQMDRSYDLVKSVVLKDTTVTVYNFEVNGSHNYFIGDKGYLVHNECRLLDIESIIRKTDDKLIDTFQDFAENVFKNVPGDGTRAALNKKIVDLGDDQKIVDFVKDFAANSDAIKKIGGKVELVDAWKLLENSARRTDIKTLKFFDDPTVVASRQKILNEKIHEAFPDVPLEELTAIQHYTTNAHLNLNKALRGEIPMTDEYRAFEELLNSGMDKLPKYNGDKVFRGVKGDEAILAKTWKEGDNVSFNDFKSTSTKASVANEFAGDVVYEISNPKGRNICGVSCLPGESEVLFKSGSNFKVKEIKPDFIVYDDDFNPFTVRKVILEFVE